MMEGKIMASVTADSVSYAFALYDFTNPLLQRHPIATAETPIS